MKTSFFTLLAITLWSTGTLAQRQCGFDITKDALTTKDPSWVKKFSDHRASLQHIAEEFKTGHGNIAYKTTATSAIPVVFHYMLTEAQLTQIGGAAGIQQRIDSQIAVLNRDFNRGNLDSILIPSGWKPLFGSSGIHFGLAHTDPLGYGTPGYTLKIIPNVPGGFTGASSNYSSAKHESSGGTDSWDVTKYLNIWVTSFADFSTLLGLTTYKSITGGSGYPLNEMGVCMNYGALGKRVLPTDYYMSTGASHNFYDMGRTLTHEMGHFFEIWHTWGDDFSKCPWQATGSDDGLADTPPEGGPKFENAPYDIPGGTFRDSCHTDAGGHEVQPIGVASLDFMNYTDDIAMHMFTNDQVAVMASQVAVGGENFSLTQHPELLEWSTRTNASDLKKELALSISPNPATDRLYITFNNAADILVSVTVADAMGREIRSISPATNSGYNTIDLTNIIKGIYFVRCNFASGTVTQKILLQ